MEIQENKVDKGVSGNEFEMKFSFSRDVGSLFCALSKAQGAMTGAAKDSNNPFFNSKYADLNSVWNSVRQQLSKNELAVIQTMGTNDLQQECLFTILGHSSGQWMKSELRIKYNEANTRIDKYGKEKEANPLQALGSCITYLRRYALSAMVGIAPNDGEDDDGNAGGTTYNNAQTVMIPHEPVKVNGYADFCRRHKIGEAESDVDDYIKVIRSKSKKTEIETINSAVLNESRFLEVFNTWKLARDSQKSMQDCESVYSSKP